MKRPPHPRGPSPLACQSIIRASNLWLKVRRRTRNVFLDSHLCQVNGTCTHNRVWEDLLAAVTFAAGIPAFPGAVRCTPSAQVASLVYALPKGLRTSGGNEGLGI